MLHNIFLFVVKYFTSHQPGKITYMYESTEDILVEFPNGNSVRIYPGQWKVKKDQKVLLETFSGSHYFMYHPISEEDYAYLIK